MSEVTLTKLDAEPGKDDDSNVLQFTVRANANQIPIPSEAGAKGYRIVKLLSGQHDDLYKLGEVVRVNGDIEGSGAKDGFLDWFKYFVPASNGGMLASDEAEQGAEEPEEEEGGPTDDDPEPEAEEPEETEPEPKAAKPAKAAAPAKTTKPEPKAAAPAKAAKPAKAEATKPASKPEPAKPSGKGGSYNIEEIDGMARHEARDALDVVSEMSVLAHFAGHLSPMLSSIAQKRIKEITGDEWKGTRKIPAWHVDAVKTGTVLTRASKDGKQSVSVEVLDKGQFKVVSASGYKGVKAGKVFGGTVEMLCVLLDKAQEDGKWPKPGTNLNRFFKLRKGEAKEPVAAPKAAAPAVKAAKAEPKAAAKAPAKAAKTAKKAK